MQVRKEFGEEAKRQQFSALFPPEPELKIYINLKLNPKNSSVQV